MPRYIDAELIETAIKEYAHRYIDDEEVYNDIVDIAIDIKDIIRSTPTADVAEVKRGEWKEALVCDSFILECSSCTKKLHVNYANLNTYNYCPNCGAKMGGKDESI